MQTASAYRDFSVRLHDELLDEAAFVYEQALAWRDDPELTWLDGADLDTRLEAQIDGLVVGGEAASELCSRRAADGDAAVLHAALRVACRLGRRDRVAALLETLPGDDGPLAAAAADALAADCPPAWHDALAQVAAAHPGAAAAIAPAIARDGRRAEAALVGLLTAAGDASAAPVLRALGLVAGPGCAAAVEPYLTSDSPDVAASAAVAALRCGSARVAGWLPAAAKTRPELILPAALGGGRAAVAALCDIAGAGGASEAALTGLGLLGDLGATRVVFEHLTAPETARAAAMALQLMTGAELFGETFVPAQPDPDEWFDDERARFDATGEVPKKPDGRDYGATEVRIVTDPAVWKAWIAANRARFDPKLRYRYGEPVGPQALLRSLAAERLPNRIRTLVCDELKIRYDCNFPLSTSMPVAEQRRLLDRLAEWVGVKGGAFAHGVWHFAGEPAGD